MQIVGYDRPPAPAIVVADRGDVERIDLTAGTQLTLGIGERRCAGRVRADEHDPCAHQTAPWCPEHAETWVCARCRGTCLKDEMDCHQDHVVYLAVVAPDVMKVGVTRAARCERRLLEQGADRGAIIHEVRNGRIAREIEAEIARDMSDRIPVARKVAGLGRAVDDAAWERLCDDFDPIRRYRPDHDCDVEGHPIPETIATGTVRGTKGRLLLLEAGASTYASDLRDLVGHEVIADGDAVDRQSGLGAFA